MQLTRRTLAGCSSELYGVWVGTWGMMNRGEMARTEADGSRPGGEDPCMGQQKAKYRRVLGPWNEFPQIILLRSAVQSVLHIIMHFPVTTETRLNGKDKDV